MKKKQLRLEFIRQAVAASEIELQEDLLALLLENGFDATQATLSRDLKELKIAKMPNSDGRYCYRLHRETDVRVSALRNAVQLSAGEVSLEFSQNIAVLRTMPGYASVVAANIDACCNADVLGTIAGDDTVMIVLRENVARRDFAKNLKTVIPSLIYSF